MSSPRATLTDRLRDLHDEYIRKVNAADARQPELVSELADQYADEAQRLIVGAGAQA